MAALYIQLGKAHYKDTDVKTRQLTNPKNTLIKKVSFNSLFENLIISQIFYHCYLLSF
jgi:hypothetical protein